MPLDSPNYLSSCSISAKNSDKKSLEVADFLLNSSSNSSGNDLLVDFSTTKGSSSASSPSSEKNSSRKSFCSISSDSSSVKNSLIKSSALIEFALLGLISGILGSLMAYGGIYFIETRVFQTVANFYPEIWIMGPFIGLVVVSILCFYLINGIIRQSPKELLMR